MTERGATLGDIERMFVRETTTPAVDAAWAAYADASLPVLAPSQQALVRQGFDAGYSAGMSAFRRVIARMHAEALAARAAARESDGG